MPDRWLAAREGLAARAAAGDKEAEARFNMNAAQREIRSAFARKDEDGTRHWKSEHLKWRKIWLRIRPKEAKRSDVAQHKAVTGHDCVIQAQQTDEGDLDTAAEESTNIRASSWYGRNVVDLCISTESDDEADELRPESGINQAAPTEAPFGITRQTSQGVPSQVDTAMGEMQAAEDPDAAQPGGPASFVGSSTQATKDAAKPTVEDQSPFLGGLPNHSNSRTKNIRLLDQKQALLLQLHQNQLQMRVTRLERKEAQLESEELELQLALARFEK